jgi:hypothetical protein
MISVAARAKDFELLDLAKRARISSPHIQSKYSFGLNICRSSNPLFSLIIKFLTKGKGLVKTEEDSFSPL